MTQHLVSTATDVMAEGYPVFVNKMENRILVRNKSEKPLVLDLLKIYRENECLWNTNCSSFGSKMAKHAAYLQMLKRYKLFDPKADMKMVRRRIDNLRSSYRREHKKVLHEKNHVPVLWYYRNMTFLNDYMTFPPSPRPTNDIDEHDVLNNYMTFPPSPRPINDIDKNSGAGGSGDGHQPKMRLFDADVKDEVKDDESGAEDNYATEYLENETEDDPNQEETYQIKLTEEPYVIKPKEVATEASVFGRAVGLQLDELTAIQKTIAEKLISDVIYNARLDKLTTQTSLINLNNDDSS